MWVLPYPGVWWEGRGEGGAAGALASAGASDSAASSLPGVGVAGSSRSQESFVLADPSPVDSSVSAGGDRRSPLARLASLRGTAPAHALPVHLHRVVKMIVKSVAVPTLGLRGRVPGLASRALAPRTVCGLVDESALAVTRHAPPLPMCGLDAPGLGLLTATGTSEYTRALGATVRSHGSRYRSRDRRRPHDRSPPSDRSRSVKRSWQLGQSCRDHEEAVVPSRNRDNSGSTVVPTPAVAGGSIPLPTSSFPDLVRLFLSLSGPVAQQDAAVGSLLSAAGVTGAGVLPGPAAPVTSAAPVACSSAMPAPGVLNLAGAASATALPGRCERAWGSSRSERCRRRSSGRERSHSGGKRGRGRSPSSACSARLASVSASSSSVSSDAEGRVSVMPPPPSGRSGIGGGRS